MNAVDFPESNLLIGKGQNQYHALPAYAGPDNPHGELIFCFELSPEELQEVNRTGKLWMRQWTFGKHFQPICIEAKRPFINPEPALPLHLSHRSGMAPANI